MAFDLGQNPHGLKVQMDICHGHWYRNPMGQNSHGLKYPWIIIFMSPSIEKKYHRNKIIITDFY